MFFPILYSKSSIYIKSKFQIYQTYISLFVTYVDATWGLSLFHKNDLVQNASKAPASETITNSPPYVANITNCDSARLKTLQNYNHQDSIHLFSKAVRSSFQHIDGLGRSMAITYNQKKIRLFE